LSTLVIVLIAIGVLNLLVAAVLTVPPRRRGR